MDTFRRHLCEAEAAGYRFATLGTVLDVLSGRRRSPDDLCVITFDDGYRDVYRHAFPVLKEMGVPAVVYLAAGLVGTDRRFEHDRLFHLMGLLRARRQRPIYDALPVSAPELLEPFLRGAKTPSRALDDFIADHGTPELAELAHALGAQFVPPIGLEPEQGEVMDWDEVRHMASHGIQMGAHTVNHTVLTLADAATIEREIVESKAAIEREVGRPVLDFAYPNGWYSEAVVSALIKAGFRSAVTTEDALNEIGGDPFALQRKVLWENFSKGLNGEYSASLTGCHLDDVFSVLGLRHPVLGKRGARPPANAVVLDGTAAHGFPSDARR